MSSSSSSSSTPPSSSYAYRNSASHHSTLIVLAKVKNFDKLTLPHLIGYCGLVLNENGCQSALDAAETLSLRFGWPTAKRMSEIETAWKQLTSDVDADNDDDGDNDDAVLQIVPTAKSKEDDNGKKKKQKFDETGANTESLIAATSSSSKKQSKTKVTQQDDDTVQNEDKEEEVTKSVMNAGRMPIIIKANAWDKKVLLCEVDDQEFDIAGDSGAVGRISVDTSSIMIDVKGRQYRGSIRPGPTMMLLNLAAPVGQSTSASSYQQTARAEVVTNEICELTFEKDLLGSMMGVYTGGTGEDDDSDDDENNAKIGTKKGAKKSRKSKGDSEDEMEVDDDDDEDRRGSKGSAPRAPKISTITQRKRQGKTTKKGGKAKKATKAKK